MDNLNLNPLKRLREEAGLSVAQISREGGGSEVFILNAEAGMYQDPPERVIKVLADYYRGVLDAPSLTAEYHNWQTATRKANYGALNPSWLEAGSQGSTESIHPFLSWRTYSGITSRIRTSKLYCIHPATISQFELKPWRLSGVPPTLLKVLEESGYSSESLEVLVRRWVSYKSYLGRTIAPSKRVPDLGMNLS